MSGRLDIAGIRARAEAATPGPWADMGDSVFAGEVRGCVGFEHVCSDPDGDDRAADRAFIAHARTDIPALCDEVTTLHQALTLAHEALLAALPCVEAAEDLCRNSTPASTDRGLVDRYNHDASARTEKVREALAATTDDELAARAREEAEERAAWERLERGLDAASRQRDEAYDEIRELRATLANERGEGEPPSEGWKPDGFGWIKGVGPFADAAGPIFAGCVTVRRRNGEWTATCVNWRVDRLGSPIGPLAAPTAREAMRAADNALTTPTPGASK